MTSIELEMERTPAGIPVSLRPFFQEYTLEDLDPERCAFTVIGRTLAWGDVEELRWLFAHYAPERLADWVRDAGWYLLPRRRFLYWRCFFDLDDWQQGERVWPH